MVVGRTTRGLLGLAVMAGVVFAVSAESPLTYLILADTVEPLMIVTEADPMAGGIVTDTLREVLADSPYEINPLVIPWQRIAIEMRARDDWIMYGTQSQCKPDSGCAHSTGAIVQFEHVIVTLSDMPLEVQAHKDLFGKRLLLVENFHYPGLDPYLTTPVDGEGSGDIRDIRAFAPENALNMLRHRRGDAYIDWRLRVLYNLPDAGLARHDVRLTDASRLVPTQNVHFLFSDKLPAGLRHLIDARLSNLRQDGALDRIVNRYR